MNAKLHTEDGTKKPMQEISGAWLEVSLSDILGQLLHSMLVFSRFMQNPAKRHFGAARWILHFSVRNLQFMEYGT